MTKSNLERNTSWQEPEPELRKRKGRPGIWSAQYRRYDADGTVDRPREVFGDVIEFPNKTAVKSSHKYKTFIERVNRIRAVVLFHDLCRLYREEEIAQRCFKGQATAKGQLCYLEDKWGEYRLDQLIHMSYEIRTWLQSDTLISRRNPQEQLSRQSRKHLRTMFVMMMKYAAEKHYLPYNPFTGTVLSVKKGGAPPVDRSEFFVSPEQFRWMMNDPETPGHVKTMMLVAYTTGMRSSEFLGLIWDDIDFDGQEPRIYIRRGVDGKHVQKAKTEKSKAPVPMCDRIGAALLCYRDEYPSVGGWVFGSLRTGRPLHRTQVGADYLLPALWRMAAKFKLRIPDGTGFHAFRHAYNALITQVGADDPKRVKEVQMQLMRHTDERINDRYGKSAAPLRERARQAQADVTELVMGGVN
jgi:integrase